MKAWAGFAGVPQRGHQGPAGPVYSRSVCAAREPKVPTEGLSVREPKAPHSRRKSLKWLEAPAGLPRQKSLEEAASESTSTLTACLKHIAGPVLVDEIGLMLATSALAAPVLVEGVGQMLASSVKAGPDLVEGVGLMLAM